MIDRGQMGSDSDEESAVQALHRSREKAMKVLFFSYAYPNPLQPGLATFNRSMIARDITCTSGYPTINGSVDRHR